MKRILLFTLFIITLMVSGCGDLNGNACEITFPAYKVNQTEYNADAFNITPFKMHITLPQNVYIKNVKDMDFG